MGIIQFTIAFAETRNDRLSGFRSPLAISRGERAGFRFARLREKRPGPKQDDCLPTASAALGNCPCALSTHVFLCHFIPSSRSFAAFPSSSRNHGCRSHGCRGSSYRETDSTFSVRHEVQGP